MAGRTTWVDALSERLGRPLPGETAHAGFRALPDEVARTRYQHEGPPRQGSVLVLFYGSEDGVYFPLILRTPYPGAHGGQVSFPGGKNEPGEDSVRTALRETQEEIGAGPEGIRILGSLTPYHIIPSNMYVHPVVAWIDVRPEFRADAREVARIIPVPLTELMSARASGWAFVEAGGNRWEAPCFFLGGEVVWGATAMMLNELRLVISECHPDHRLP